jgi:LCP family protein required for cell wall assembly
VTPRRRLALVAAALATASVLSWSVLDVPASSAAGKTIFIHKISTGYYREGSTRPVFILALGSDHVSLFNPRPGPPDRGNADSIHIISIDPATRSGTIVGIPRDTWISNDHGYTGKINGAMGAGGPDEMLRVVEDLTGVTFDYYVLTSFDGFYNAVNALHGLVVDVPYNMRDSYSHANFRKGIQVMDGYSALAFARNRHDTPDGDFSRSFNQGLVMLGGLRKARADFFDDPGELLNYLAVFFRSVQTDLPIGEAIDLAMLVSTVRPESFTNIVAPGYPAMVGAASIVRLYPKAFPIFHDVADDGLLNGSAPGSTAIPSSPSPSPSAS